MTTPGNAYAPGNELAGKVALVTGAAKNIGRATALMFAEQGDRKAERDQDRGLLDDAREVPAPSLDAAIIAVAADDEVYDSSSGEIECRFKRKAEECIQAAEQRAAQRALQLRGLHELAREPLEEHVRHALGADRVGTPVRISGHERDAFRLAPKIRAGDMELVKLGGGS